MNIGDKVKSIEFELTGDKKKNVEDFSGRWLILYFYPKDSTPGCTIEGQDFRDHYEEFKALNASILGISRDSLASHEKFKTKQSFPFDLISDKKEELCQLFDVIKMKNMFGKQSRGVERSTFLIDPEGYLKHEWRKVKVKGHVADVMATLKKLQ